jgi:hypothetical protein
MTAPMFADFPIFATRGFFPCSIATFLANLFYCADSQKNLEKNNANRKKDYPKLFVSRIGVKPQGICEIFRNFHEFLYCK